MIIVMKPDSSPDHVDALLARIADKGLTPLHMPGSERVVLGALGDERILAELQLEADPQVESVKPILSPYKLVSRESAPLMPKEGSLVWKRAGFARHTVHVTKCKPNRSLSYLFIALTHTQTRMISCTPLAAMLSRLQANHQLVHEVRRHIHHLNHQIRSHVH